MCLESSFRRSLPGISAATIGLLVAVVALTRGVTDLRASDDDQVVDAPPEPERVEPDVDDEETARFCIENDGILRHDLEMRWRRHISTIDRLCHLTEIQKQKLELVSRGDIKRLLDRKHDIDARVQLAKTNPREVQELAREAQQLQYGTSTVRSLMANFMERLLTPEQFARYEPLRIVIHLGGRFQSEDPDTLEVLEIDIHGTTFGDDDAVNFGASPRLQRLLLAGTQIGDDALAHVQDLRNLIWLDVARTRVTDAGLQHLHALTHLHRLSLAHTRVTNRGLAHLQRLTNLEALDLDGTLVTDAGMLHLAGLTNLQRLYLRNTHVTEAALHRLQQALPHLTIHVRGRHLHRNEPMGMGFF